MRSLAIVINARIASTRVPNKLIRPFGNTTLLNIALSKLSEIKWPEKYLAACDAPILSTYDLYADNIKLLPRKKSSVQKGEQPHHIAFEHYKLLDTQYIMIMNPCLPFTTPSVYETAIKYFQSNKQIKSMTSVIKYKDLFFHNDVPINVEDITRVSTKYVQPIHKMAHVFHIIDKDKLLAGQIWDYSPNNPYLSEINQSQCFDIDTEEDFEMCEQLYKANYHA